MTPEQANKSYVNVLMSRTESLQNEMHQYIEETMEKDKNISYQDCVNTFFLFKLAQMDLVKASKQAVFG